MNNAFLSFLYIGYIFFVFIKKQLKADYIHNIQSINIIFITRRKKKTIKAEQFLEGNQDG